MTDTATAAAPTIGGLPIQKAGERVKWLKALIWGDPGVGKTLLAATSEEVERMRPVLYVDIEGGAEVFQERYPDIHIVEIKDTYDSSGRVKKLAWEKFNDVNEDLRTGKHKYGTVIVDNLTEAYDLVKTWWLYNVTQERPERDPDMPAERDWVKQGALMRKMFRLYRDLPMHVIFTAHKGTRETEGGVLKNYVPEITGKLAYQIAGFVGEVLYLDVVQPSKKEQEANENPKGKRRLLTQPVNKYICKDRSDQLPMLLENPTMKDIYSLVVKQ